MISHHIFTCVIEDLAHHIALNDMYALEFEVIGRNQIMSVRFWKENTLVWVPLFRCPLVAGFPSTFITGLSRLLSVVSFKPGLVIVSGCYASLVRTLDNCGLFSRGVQYPFQVRRAVSADPDAQGGRKRLRVDGLLLTTAVFDRVP